MVLRWLVALTLSVGIARAQFGTIVGVVVEQSSGDPIVGATIRLGGLPHGAVSRRDGSFVLRRVPAGNLTVLVSAVGYHPAEQRITLGSGDTVRVRIGLRS